MPSFRSFLWLSAIVIHPITTNAQCDQWTPLSSGAPANVLAMIVWDPDGLGPSEKQLIVGGNFTSIGGVPANRIARWDGAAWHPLGDGVGSTNVSALGTWDPDGNGPNHEHLIVGGNFTLAGGVPANDVARWDGSTWHSLGTGVTQQPGSEVTSIVSWDHDADSSTPTSIIIGGFFFSVGNVEAGCIARWDGALWHALGAGFSSSVHELTTLGPVLVAGGSFSGKLLQWDGSTWTPFGLGVDFDVLALTTYDADNAGPLPTQLFAGGLFENAGGAPAFHVAQWNGSTWSAMGTGLAGQVQALCMWDPDASGPVVPQLVAGMFFTTGNPMPAEPRLARWNGAAWIPFGVGPDNSVRSACTWDADGPGPLNEALIVGGSFTSIDAIPVNRIASFNPCSPPPPQCPGDTNGDLQVNSADLSVLLAQFGTSVPAGTGADFNNDGLVNSADLSVLLAAFGTGC